MSSLPYYLGFSYCSGIGPHTFNALIDKFKNPKKAYEGSHQELKNILGQVGVEKFLDHRERFDAAKEFYKLSKNGITILTREDEHFPRQLLDISDPPICLYIKGDVSQIDFGKNLLAIVGTRQASSYGLKAAHQFAYELSKKGFTIVSGLARGIDGCAHRAAIEAGGKTIAVLGCNISKIYPSENVDLYWQIVKDKGVIISEFPPGYAVLKGVFIARNRLISGLAKGVLIVEGKNTSGAIHTAHYAAYQGRDVFAIPGSIYAQNSEAPNGLLLQGATPVVKPEDISYEYGYKTYNTVSYELPIDLLGDELLISSLLKDGPLSSDELFLSTKLPIYQILPVLSSLEIKGVVEKNREGLYQLK